MTVSYVPCSLELNQKVSFGQVMVGPSLQVQQMPVSVPETDRPTGNSKATLSTQVMVEWIQRRPELRDLKSLVTRLGAVRWSTITGVPPP